MTELATFAPGTPCWIDLSSPNIEASVKFYGDLFGWKHESSGPPELTGGYGMFKLGGRDVAGIGPRQEGGAPPLWTTYVAVDDADETAAKVRDAGGGVVVEPMDVLDAGRMAVFTDRSGAMFATWQPGRHRGAEVVMEPGALCWNELTTRDVAGSTEFYGAVFGWQGSPLETPDVPYTQWMLDGKAVGGMIEMDDKWPAEVPPHWMVYFAVADTDATAARAKELGGSAPVEPFDIMVGRIAVLNDPDGVAFSVIKPIPMD